MNKSISKRASGFTLFCCSLLLFVCTEYGKNPRTNPYDPRVPGFASVKSITALTHDGYSCCPSFSPDGGRVVFSQLGLLSILDLSADTLEGIKPIEGTAPQWSPIDDKIIYFNNGNIFLATYPEMGQKQLTHDKAGTNGNAVWSPDAGSIAFLSVDDSGRGISTMDSSGLDRRMVARARYLERIVGWSYQRNGDQLLIIQRSSSIENPTLRLLDIQSRKFMSFDWNHKVGVPVDAAWSIDGSELLHIMLSTRYEMWLRDVDGSEVCLLTEDRTELLPNPARWMDHLDWSSDRKLVLFEGASTIYGNERDIYLLSFK